MTKKDKNIDLEVVKVGFANGVAEGFPLSLQAQRCHLVHTLLYIPQVLPRRSHRRTPILFFQVL